MSLTHLWNREAITELLSQITEVFILVEGQCQKFCAKKIADSGRNEVSQ